MTQSIKNNFVNILSSIMVVLFLYAAITKLIDGQKFHVELGKSPLLNPFTKSIGIGIPALEVCISILFFREKTKLLAFYLSFGLMVTFTVYIVFILNFSDYIPCSCGGVIQNLTWTEHIVFNIAFIVVSALGVLIIPFKKLSADKGGDRKPLTE